MQKETSINLITIPYHFERAAPRFGDEAIRYPEGLVRYFLNTHTKKGARVFDPFAGLGTTLFVAEEMGRHPYGIEADPKRHAWVAGQLENWKQLVCDDAAKLHKYGFPKIDFCMTSPPFMARNHQWNPLFAGNPKHAGYAKYLAQMGRIFGRVTALMKKGGVVVVQADNITAGRIYTPLVADLQTALSKHLTPIGDTLIQWQNPKPDYGHTHCLIFKKT